MKKGVLIFGLLFIFLLAFVSAHQPRIVFGVDNSANNPVIVKNPEISQAFYGILNGKPDYYLVNSEGNFNLYVGMVTPYEQEIKDFNFEIYKENKLIEIFNGSEIKWVEFYEEFGGDKYWQGSEFDENVSAGSYLIKVYNSDNQGKYSLAIGKAESFPLDESLKTLFILPRLKKEFFGKSYFSLFEGKIIQWLSLLVLFLIIIIMIIYIFVRKYMKKHLKKH
ncbi:MAG: hypothetical protein WC781_01905 [Candidatus Pacearchaeota archaeon]|jgi:hypothetical protein